MSLLSYRAISQLHHLPRAESHVAEDIYTTRLNCQPRATGTEDRVYKRTFMYRNVKQRKPMESSTALSYHLELYAALLR